MKKFSKILALLFAALMVFTLVACGKGGNTPSGSGSAEPEETPLVLLSVNVLPLTVMVESPLPLIAPP